MTPFEKVKWVEWVDPVNKKNDPVYCRVRPRVAIQCSKEAALISGHVYANDQDAFEDFVVVNWGYIIPKPEPKNK